MEGFAGFLLGLIIGVLMICSSDSITAINGDESSYYTTVDDQLYLLVPANAVSAEGKGDE